MKRLLASIALSLFVLLSGCVAGAPPQTISSNPLVYLASTDDLGLFAADQDCHSVAFTREGLVLMDMETGSQKVISEARPSALAWNATGELLAAAYSVGDYETRLVQYSAQGDLLNDLLLPVAFSGVKWSTRGDLLLSGFILKVYSFGANLQQLLYQIDGELVAETILSDTTLNPDTVKLLSPIMQDVLPVIFSPAGDELVFAELHDPPEFSPYLQLQYRNWQFDRSRSLQQMPLQVLRLDWDRGRSTVRVASEAGVQEIALWPLVDRPDKSAAVGYSFINGRFYDGDELLADWGDAAQMQVLKDGRFLLSVEDRLYLGDGLREQLAVSYNEKHWNLRRWRFEELITPGEYQELLRENQK